MGKEQSIESLTLLRPNLDQETIMEAKFSSITGSISKQSAESRQRKLLCQERACFNLGGGTVIQEAGSTFRFQFCLELETPSKESLLCSYNSVSSSVNQRLGNTHRSNGTAVECLADIRYPTRCHLHPGPLPPSNSSRPGEYYTSSHKGMCLSLGLGQARQ